MLNVSQDWEDAQKKQLTPESNVKIVFKLDEEDYTINKKNIESFKYTQSGSVVNDSLITKEISFNLFINENYVEIPLKTLCTVYFSYKINGEWEEVVVGDFYVKDKSIPQNGLVAHYELSKSFSRIRMKVTGREYITYFDDEYNKGSNIFILDLDHRPAVVLSSLQYLAQNAFSGANYAVNYAILPDTLCGRTLDNCSYAELLQQIAIASGTTVDYTKGHSTPTAIVHNDVAFKKFDKTTTDIVATIETNTQYKYPEFESVDIKELEINVYKNNKKFKSSPRVEDRTNIEFELNEETDEYTYCIVPINNDEVFGLWLDAYEFEDYRWFFYGNAVELRSYDKHSSADGGYIVMDTTNSKIISNIKENGDTINVDNCLITANQYEDANEYLIKWLTDVRKISVECRIDPALELFDKVWIKDKSNNYNACVLEYVEISYNGGFKGKVEGRQYVPHDTPEPYIKRKTIDVADFNDGKECVIEQMSSLSVFLNMQTTGANGMIWRRRNRQTLEIIDEFEKPCGRVAIGQKKDPDTKEVLGNYVGVYEHTTGSQYKLLEPNPISTEFNSGDEVWTITLKAGYSLHFSRSGYERYLLDNFSGYIDYQ